MGKFLDQERIRQAEFKRISPYFSDEARIDGAYRGTPYAFLLPDNRLGENFYTDIRSEALQYFADHRISWHTLARHLCSSQVCCLNFLFPFTDKPEALACLLRPLFPDLKHMLPVESAGNYVAFEWIGEQNYLGERLAKNGVRTRGANCTSADAFVRYETINRKVHAVLIEWKYTESYSSSTYHISKSGTDRTAIYRHLYEQADCPLRRDLIPEFGDLFYEPFYQLMRQQLLAWQMEKAKEMDADGVSVLHLQPAVNTAYESVTSPALRPLGETVSRVWKKLVVPQDRFASHSIEDVFGSFPIEKFPELRGWWNYMHERYVWLLP